MYLKVRLRPEEKVPAIEIKVNIPHGTRNDTNALNDVVSDYLDEKGIKYKWYKIESIPHLPIQYPDKKLKSES